MKNLILLLAVGALTMTGCKYESGGTIASEVQRRTRFEETTGSQTRITNYEYNEMAQPIGETETLNGAPVYEETGYEYDNPTWTITRYRTVHTSNGAINQKRVSTYTAGWEFERKFEVFQLGAGGSETEPVENWEVTLSGAGRVSGVTSHKDGLNRIQYDYSYEGKTVNYKMKEFTDADPNTIVEKTVTEVYLDTGKTYYDTITTKIGDDIFEFTMYGTDNKILESYKTYSGGDDKTGILIEERDNFEAIDGNLSATWDVTRYDAEGKNPVVTRFRETTKMIPITITYGR